MRYFQNFQQDKSPKDFVKQNDDGLYKEINELKGENKKLMGEVDRLSNLEIKCE